MIKQKTDKKNTLLFLFFVSVVLLITGCGSNSGSYISPISILPYTSGDEGAIRGKIYANIMPGEYFDINYSESGAEDTAENPVFSETNDNTRIFYSKAKGVIRIAGKKYIFNPEIDHEFYISGIPTGFHSIIIESPGFEKFEQTIRIESGVKEMDFVISHPEDRKPNYYSEIANIDGEIISQEIENEEDSAETKFYVDLSSTNTTRFITDDIKVYIDDATLLSLNQVELSQEFIEMLGKWEVVSNKFKFTLVDNREDANITTMWVPRVGTEEVLYTMTEDDPQYPEYDFKPVITLNVYLPSLDRLPSETIRKRVMLKAIGKALGLLGSSPNPNDILYSGDENVEIDDDVKLSEADKNTLLMLYDTVPGISENTINLYTGGQ
ncbi:MAG: hypothetical protein C0601_11325 [Candidatus Muiribacterium halophilum]|uniref:PEGA domain-containing protein n=1 Tax=Muiribacterium halophilum TaxID=2053465 RepID=A0A2N5ZC85_MUIH1|nr:MAG: hypothetical protein C0601_11325 [Candidatus Muirbacterium halophilum]